jgi:hypothetical protein
LADAFTFIEIWQVAVPLQPPVPPIHPVNTEYALGVAVSVTSVPPT